MPPQDKRAELSAMAEAGMSGLQAYRRGEQVVKSDQMAAIDAALSGAHSRNAPAGADAALDSIIRPVGDAAQGRLAFAGDRHAASMSEQGSAIDRFTSRAPGIESMAYDVARSDAQRSAASGGGGGLSTAREQELRASEMGRTAAREDGAALLAKAEKDLDTRRIGVLAAVSDGALNSKDARSWLQEKKVQQGDNFEAWFDAFVAREAQKTGQQKAHNKYLADYKKAKQEMAKAMEGMAAPPPYMNIPMPGGGVFRANTSGQAQEPRRASMQNGVIAPVMGDEYTSMIDDLYASMNMDAANRMTNAQQVYGDQSIMSGNLTGGLYDNDYAADAYQALGYGDEYVARALFDPYRTMKPVARAEANAERAYYEQYGMPEEDYEALVGDSTLSAVADLGFSPSAVEKWAKDMDISTGEAVAAASNEVAGSAVLSGVELARELISSGQSKNDIRRDVVAGLRAELEGAGLPTAEVDAYASLLSTQLNMVFSAYGV